MSDLKTERLINLTLALLASNRYLTKSEIFTTVAGYRGSDETMERMFERDKDEIRNLGIVIEVRGVDPLFEDEQGYLINSDTFQIKLDEFSQEDLLYLTMAANLWHASALQNESKTALLKIQSLSGPIEANSINSPVIQDNEDSKTISTIFDAMEKYKVLTFEYKGTIRKVEPYGLYTQSGFWYLVAKENSNLKTFKLVRIDSGVEALGKPGDFAKPSDFDLSLFLNGDHSEIKSTAVIKVRKNQALSLRSKFGYTEIDSEWDHISIDYKFKEDLIENLLWYGDSVIVITPTTLKEEIVERAKRLLNG